MVADQENKTIDVSQKPEEVLQAGQPKRVHRREGALSSIGTKVSEKDLKDNLPAIRLIVEENYKLKEDVKNLEGFRKEYYDKKERVSVLEEKLNTLNTRQILTTTGGILTGFTPFVWTEWKNLGFLVGVSIIAFIFLAAGFFKKTNQT